MTKKINELEVGTLAQDFVGNVAKVKECVHGNKDYANFGHINDMDDMDAAEVVEVSDMDEDMVSECCG